MNMPFGTMEPSAYQDRYEYLKSMLEQQKREIVNTFDANIQNYSRSKKFKDYEDILRGKLQAASKFITNLTNYFFVLVLDDDFLMMTPEIDINQKITKYKKNLQGSWQKIIANFDAEIQSIQMKKINPNNQNLSALNKRQESFQQFSEQLQMNDDEPVSSKRGHRSKNFKISNDATLSMMKWMLNNFQNPYPTTEQKQQMAIEGDISLSKVNNWFINARERTVKSYFSKGK